MALDGFLEIIDSDNPVAGETLDKDFKKTKGMAIKSFRLSPTSEAVREASEEEKDRANAMASEMPFADDAPEEQSRPSFRFEITKEVDNGSPNLFQGYCRFTPKNFKPYQKARVTIRKGAGPKPMSYLILEFSNVFVSNYTVTMDSGEELPTETVTFSFETCKFQYYPQTTAGTAGTLNEKSWSFLKSGGK